MWVLEGWWEKMWHIEGKKKSQRIGQEAEDNKVEREEKSEIRLQQSPHNQVQLTSKR